MKKYNVAVVGATGNVGREILNILEERAFPIENIYALASSSSIGKEVSFGDTKILKIEDTEDFDFSIVDLTFMAVSNDISKKYTPHIAGCKSVVIDNSSHFRLHNDVPLVVPEVNSHALKNDHMIIANPNCAAAQMVVALNPIHEEFGIKRIVVSTYQSVSGAGLEAMDELYNQTKSMYVNEFLPPKKFHKRIAFNLIPQIDTFLPDGYTREEDKVIKETKKIMGHDINITATCVRVPVFVGHSESINIELENDASVADIIKVLRKAPGVSIVNNNEDGGYACPVDVVQEDNVFVSRIRKDDSIKNGFNLWVCADNLRKGAALNAVQIAETRFIRKG